MGMYWVRDTLAHPKHKLVQPPTIRNLLIWHDEYHLPVTVGEAEYQDLRHELADLLGREIDHGSDLAADQVLERVARGRAWAEVFLTPIPAPKSTQTL